MPIIDHSDLPETPWRPNYRKWEIAGPKDGISSSLSHAVLGGGAGAPLHFHEDDELIVVLEGVLEVRIGDEVHQVPADHTVVVPPGVPHGFTCVGPDRARIMGFFPVPNPFDRTTYLEGVPSPRS